MYINMFVSPEVGADYCSGTLFGKRMIVTNARELSSRECEVFFSKFNFMDLAREICGLAKHLLAEKNCVLCGRYFTDRTLCIALTLAVKYASRQSPGKQIDVEDLKMVIEIAWGEDEKKLLSLKYSSEILNGAMYAQQVDRLLYLIARYWCMFSCLWPRDVYDVDPLKVIENEYGVSYKIILFFALASSKDGHLFAYDNAQDFSGAFGCEIDRDAHKRFLKHFSCGMDDWVKESIPPQYVRTPILRTDMIPDGMTKPVYFVPSSNNLLARVTVGMYHEIADKYNHGAGDNKFRVLFGNVFENYVGSLLNFYVKNRNISRAIKYGSKKNPKETVDFLVRKERTLILIEVKQASIYAEAQYTGNLDLIKANLRKTVLKAVEQLRITENLLKNGEKSLSVYHDCDQIKKLIVLNSPLYNANNICKMLLDEMGKSAADVSIINISEFETLLDLQSETQDLWEMLEMKESEEYKEFDFNEFFHYAYPDRSDKAEFLKIYFRQIYDGSVFKVPAE